MRFESRLIICSSYYSLGFVLVLSLSDKPVIVPLCRIANSFMWIVWTQHFLLPLPTEPPELQPAGVPAVGSGQTSGGAEEKPGSSGGVPQGPRQGGGQSSQGGPIPGFHRQCWAQGGNGTQRPHSSHSCHGTTGLCPGSGEGMGHRGIHAYRYSGTIFVLENHQNQPGVPEIWIAPQKFWILT